MISFTNDQAELAEYLCYLARMVAGGFYQERRFLVLPRLEEGNNHTVYFPDLPYSRNFWLKNGSLTEAKKLLRSCPPAKFEKLEKLWRQKEKAFFNEVRHSLPKYDLTKISKIKVLVSPFGSSGSFFYKKVGRQYDFFLTVRQDMGPVQIAEGILSLFTQIAQPTSKLTLWYITEANIDYLLSHTAIGKVFCFAHKPTIPLCPEKLPENLVAESQKYLNKLGFPVKPILSQINLKSFSPTEKKIINLLAVNKNQTVSYDQIGDQLWGNGEESLDRFSFYSISKAVEQIRKKIKDAGVYQELIYTVRKTGYVLYD